MSTPVWFEETLRGTLRAYQREWLVVLASCTFFALLGGRQIGKDRSIGGGHVGTQTVFEPGVEWHCLSASQRHANDLMLEIKRFVRLWCRVLEGQGYAAPRVEIDNISELRLSNGSRVLSHAATPRSAQGCRGNVLLNELGIMPRAEQIYETTYSIVTGQLDQGRHANMILMGNASERGSFWHTFWTGERSRSFYKATCTWQDAFTSWLKERGWGPKAIGRWVGSRKRERIEAVGAAGFAQWYECAWRSAEDGFFDVALLERQSYDPMDLEVAPRLDDPRVAQWLGYDVGRHVHPAVITPLLSGQSGWYGGRSKVMRQMPYPLQRHEAQTLGRLRRTEGMVMDSSGIGDSVFEELSGAAPFKVVPFNFGGGNKRLDLFSALRDGLETSRIWLPLDDTDLRMEMESVAARHHGGRVDILLPEEGGGHCDRAVSLALASWGALGRTHLHTGVRWNETNDLLTQALEAQL